MSTAGLGRTIPALPVRDVRAAVTHFSERFGFSALHATADFAVLSRDDAIVHLWSAGDESWSGRRDLADRPVCSGAESFLAGTASCRIETEDVDALYAELRQAGVLHAVSRDGITTTDFGTREFATLDLDGNLVSFFRWV
jgi:uncharacterized glyoxalase superfamily protein PhnB